MKPRTKTIIFFIFALSGFSGIIYESIWTHYLKLFLGHAAYAQTLVLAIFMGGMALGSWASTHYLCSWRRPFVAYAVVEGLVGLAGLIFHNIYKSATALSYSSVMPALGSSTMIDIYKCALSGLLILPQSVLLGMTFPLISMALIRNYPARPGRLLSMLYFTNSIGAAMGILASGFLLVPAIGLPGTVRTAGVMNILLAASVWWLSRNLGESPGAFSLISSRGKPKVGKNKNLYRLMLFTAFITGTASLIYEVGWIRMLSLVLGSTTHAFELMLSAFLLGLALGGLWIRKRIDTLKSPVVFLAKVQLLMGFFALSTLCLYDGSFTAMFKLMEVLEKTESGYVLFNTGSHVIALLIMLPATFCAGMTLPLVTYCLLRDGYSERSIGAVYAANTVGAIAGVLLAVHVGLPILGLKGAIIAGACLDIAMGLLLVWGNNFRGWWKRPAALAAAALGVVVLVSFTAVFDQVKMASGVYRGGKLLSGKSKVIYHADGKTASISLVQEDDGSVSLRTNGKSDGNINPLSLPPTPDEYTMTLLSALPMSLRAGAKEIAVIGLGTGMSTSTALAGTGISGVDTIEIEPFVLTAAKHFGPQTSGFATDKRSRLYIDDAKSFFSSMNKKYDIIISEPSNPWISGIANLFSIEFFELVSRHLNEDGLFVQWLNLYGMEDAHVSSVMKGLGRVFSNYEVYVPITGDSIIVASNGPGIGLPTMEIFSSPEMKERLLRINIRSDLDFHVRRIGGRGLLEPLFNSYDVPVHSDYHPLLDYGSVKSRFMQINAMSMFQFSFDPLPIADILEGTGGPVEFSATTPTPYFKKALNIHKAYLYSVHLVTGLRPEGFNYIDKSEVNNAEALRRLFYDCSGPTFDPNRKVALFHIGKEIFGRLGPVEVRYIMSELQKAPCADKLTLMEQRWLSLLSSVGQRDAKGMDEGARLLLAKEKVLAPWHRKYLVATAMLGSIGIGRHEAAIKLYEAHKAAVNPAGDTMLYNFLLVHAKAGLSK